MLSIWVSVSGALDISELVQLFTTLITFRVQVSQDYRASRAKLETPDYKDLLAAQDNSDSPAEVEILGILELLEGRVPLDLLDNLDLMALQVSVRLCLHHHYHHHHHHHHYVTCPMDTAIPKITLHVHCSRDLLTGIT